MCVAMVVTYTGNRFWTWRGTSRHGRRRELGLFVLFNLAGLAISVSTLVLTHDFLGWTSRLADNISANVVGLGLATAFRFWAYRTFVFGAPPLTVPDEWVPRTAPPPEQRCVLGSPQTPLRAWSRCPLVVR